MAVVNVSTDTWVAQAVGGTAEYGNGTNGIVTVGPAPSGVSGDPDWKGRGCYKLDLTSVLSGASSVTSAVFTAIVGGVVCIGSRGGTIRILLEQMTTSFGNKSATGDCGLSKGTIGASNVWGVSNNIDTAHSVLHSSSSHSAGDALTWDITAMVAALLADGPDGSGNYILYFRLIAANSTGTGYDEANSARRIELYSIRDANSAHQPYLTITTGTGSISKSGTAESFTISETSSITNTGSGTVNVTDSFGVSDSLSYGGATPSWSTVVEDAGNSVGQLILPVAGATSQVLLDTVSQLNVLLQCRFRLDKIPKGGQAFFRLIGRAVDQYNHYEVAVDVDGQSSITLIIYKMVNGTRTTLRTYTDVSTFVTGAYYWLKLLIQGTSPTTISAKIWSTATSEVNWQVSAQDSQSVLQTAGTVGLGGSSGNGLNNPPLVFNFDDFTGIPQ